MIPIDRGLHDVPKVVYESPVEWIIVSAALGVLEVFVSGLVHEFVGRDVQSNAVAQLTQQEDLPEGEEKVEEAQDHQERSVLVYKEEGVDQGEGAGDV